MKVEVPDFGIIEFPDGTEDEVIRKVVLQSQENANNQKLQSEVADLGPLDAIRVGAGKTFTDLGRGVQDLYYRATGNDQAVADLAARQAEDKRLYKPLQEASPVSTTIGEILPHMAAGGVGGMAAKGAGTLANVGTQAAIGAGIGGVNYAPTLGDRGVNAAVEGAVGGLGEGVGRMLSRVVNPGLAKVNPDAQKLIKAAEGQGYRVLPSTEADSNLVRRTVEGGLESTPLGSMEFDRVSGANQGVLNRQVAQSIGEDADSITGNVIENAYDRIGGVFDDVLSGDVRIPVDDDLVADVIRIQDELVEPLITGGNDQARGLFDRTYDILERGSISGPDMQAHQSRLGKTARSAMTGANSNPELGRAIFELQDAFLNAASRELPTEQMAKLNEARRQYRHLSTVADITDTNSGDVSATKLANRLQKKDRKRFNKAGAGDEIPGTEPSYTGAKFLGRAQRPLASSGTAERLSLMHALGMGGTGAIAGSHFSPDNPTAGAIGGGLAGILAPSYMARAYLSPMARKYLSRQTSPLSQAVQAPLRQGAAQGVYGLLEGED